MGYRSRMGQWVVAYCTKPLGDAVTPVELDEALASADFWSMAELQGLDDAAGDAAADTLRYEAVSSAQRRVVRIHYRHHELGDRSMHCEHHVDPEFVREEIASQLDEDPPARVRELLPRVIETVAIELKTSDWSEMGRMIAYYLAMELGKPTRGDGLVEVEGEWWDPKTYREL